MDGVSEIIPTANRTYLIAFDTTRPAVAAYLVHARTGKLSGNLEMPKNCSGMIAHASVASPYGTFLATPASGEVLLWDLRVGGLPTRIPMQSNPTSLIFAGSKYLLANSHLVDLAIVGRNVSHVHLSQKLIAPLHLGDSPA